MIIGLYSSRPQCGKSTVAQYLAAHRGFKVLSFATPFKRMLEVLVRAAGYHPSVLENKTEPLARLGGATPRRLMQTLGTEWGRTQIASDIWVSILVHRINVRNGDNFVVDDMRFPNEYEALLALGAQLWHVWRPGESNLTAHASEGSLDTYHFHSVLRNDGDLGKLFIEADMYLQLAEMRR